MEHRVVKKEQHLTLQHALFELRGDLREIIEKMPSLFLILNMKGEIMLANIDSWQREFGYTVCEMIGKPWRHFLQPGSNTYTPDGTEGDHSTVNRWRGKDGVFKTIKWVITPLENGKMICVGNLISKP